MMISKNNTQKLVLVAIVVLCGSLISNYESLPIDDKLKVNPDHQRKEKLSQKSLPKSDNIPISKIEPSTIGPASTDMSRCGPNKDCHQVTKNDTVLVVNRGPRTDKAIHPKETELNRLFREETPDYPENEIADILKKTPDTLKNYFNTKDTALDPNTELTERIAHHDNDGEREESICRSVTRNIYPREAKLENSRVFVPNNQDFVQIISVELCQQPNEECNYLQGVLPEGFSSTCYQKYAYKKLLYLDPVESRMATDLFRYPSCCTCFVKSQTLDLRSIVNANKSSKLYVTSTVSPEFNPITINKTIGEKVEPSKDSIGETDFDISMLYADKDKESVVKARSMSQLKTLDSIVEISNERSKDSNSTSNRNSTAKTRSKRPSMKSSGSQKADNMSHTLVLDEDDTYKP